MFWRLVKLIKPLSKEMALATLIGTLTIASGIGLMATSAYLISAAALHPSVAALEVAIVGVRFFGIARGIFRYLERYISHHVTFSLLARLRTWFFEALEPLAPARLLGFSRGSSLSSGDLLSRMVADIETLQNFYVRVIAPPVIAVLIGLLMWVFLGAYNPLFVLILLIFYLLAGVGVPLLTHAFGREVGKQLIVTRADLNTQLVDSIQGMADLVAFGQESRQFMRVQALQHRLVLLQARMARISGLQMGLSNLLMNLSIWVMLIVAIPLVHADQLNGIYLALLILATLASFEAILPLPSAMQHLGSSREAARRLFEIIDADPVVLDTRTPSPKPQEYSLRIENVRFRYAPNEPDVLDEFSLTLPQGHCLALVGASGAGKSTLVNLLLRFWEQQEGQILLGGYPLQTYPQEELRQLISVVEQHTHLFNTTIRENLLIARPQATQEELVEAARQAQIHDFIAALPQGYETRVGEQGFCLSGGERQRIAIARALLKDSPILILDEPTANLDSATAEALLQTLRTVIQGRTCLMITHRLIGLEMANEIAVLEAGRIREQGPLSELMQLEGLYWQMSQVQNQSALHLNKA